MQPQKGDDGRIGQRIRERRLALGMRQVALARRVGISASYLNMLEHDRRALGGQLLAAIAAALDVAPASLGEGVQAQRLAVLRQAAERLELEPAARARAPDFAARFPDWAEALARCEGEVAEQRRQIAALSDLLAHDPVLEESLHEILSAVTAVRAIGDILSGPGRPGGLALRRFEENLAAETSRLSDLARNLAAYFERMRREDAAGAVTPREALWRYLDARGHHLPALEEAPADAALDAMLDEASEVQGPGTRALVRDHLEMLARHARALPLERLTALGTETGWDPAAILARAGLPGEIVLQRLAALPPAAPRFGLLGVDGAGTPLLRKTLPGLGLPRAGGGCALWPVYEALHRPGQLVTARLQTPEGLEAESWSWGWRANPFEPGAAEVRMAVMLFRPATGMAASPPRRIGRNCRLCPHQDCAARVEPALVTTAV